MFQIKSPFQQLKRTISYANGVAENANIIAFIKKLLN